MTHATLTTPSADTPLERTDSPTALHAALVGELLTPGHPDFDQARTVHDITIDRHPLAIVRAASAADVAAAITFARRYGHGVAVRSGGHSMAGHSMINDVVVIDLSAMRGISIDRERRTARVQAGATSGDLVGPAHAYGLALSTGDTSSVGLGGLVTGGGIGWLARQHGLTIDSLLSAEIVTADGEILTIDAHAHPDLFWAVRGGGGNFGIVTEFEFRLVPVGQVLGGVLMLPASHATIRGLLDLVVEAPDGLTTITNLMQAPPAPFVPVDRVGELVLAILTCWTGDPKDGERAIAPLRALAVPVADTIGLIPYPVMYQYTAAAAVPGASTIRHMYADHLSDASIDTVLDAMRRASSPMNMVQFRGLGGAIAHVANTATAYSHRDRRYLVAALGLWADATDDPAPHTAWVESIWQAIRHDGQGAYVNFLANEGPERLKDAYPEQTLARLKAIKRTWDPTNLFRWNQNVQP